MPRPRSMRRVGFRPNVPYFKPAGVPLAGLEEVILSVDELEALRLKDCENMEQKESASRMKISQPTFQRIYESARKKTASALVEGKALRIEGSEHVVFSRQRGLRPGFTPGFRASGRRRYGRS